MPAEREDFPVARVAALARLRLSPAEAALYQEQLAHILAFVDTVTAATFEDGRRPEAPAERQQPPERRDAVGPSLPVEAALANAPDALDDPCLIRVPKVIG
jgi:aspartyl-tRNA(Asn)/glutamyl-tRNA(Gln) amidotransferase subunit C